MLTLDAGKTALIIIDVQNEYIHKDGFFGKILGRRIENNRKILRPLRRLIDFCRRHNVLVVWVASERTDATNERNKHRILNPRFRTNPGWMGGPKKGTWNAEIAEEVRPDGAGTLIRKSRHSAFFNTSLDGLLRKRGIDTLLFSGVETNVCVEASLRDAYFRDYDVILVEDCCASGTPQGHMNGVMNVKNIYGLVLQSRRVMSYISPLEVA